MKLFQSTLPRRERPAGRVDCKPVYHFNPRSREWSDPTLFPFFYFCFPYFNPRSREGSDQSCKHITASGIISIHAPAKGATTMLMIVVQVRVISIHAPAKGATGCSMCGFGIHLISIHAPAKGATYLSEEDYAQYTFQSTLPRRERRLCETVR